MTEYLSIAELRQLTGYTRAKGQSRVLNAKGIPHRVGGRGVIVSRVHVQAWLEGRTVVSSGLNLAAVK